MDPRLNRKIRKIIAPFRRFGLKKDFTIFSNNCWGGRLYDKFGMIYNSPTIGLAINTIEFLNFVKNYKKYINYELKPISYEQIKINNEHGSYKCNLDDITINFIHYRNIDDAINKWNRRTKRDNIIVKVTYVPNPYFTKEEFISCFSKIKYKKICFTTDESLLNETKMGRVVYFKNAKIDENYGIVDEFRLSDKLLSLKELKCIINEEE